MKLFPQSVYSREQFSILPQDSPQLPGRDLEHGTGIVDLSPFKEDRIHNGSTEDWVGRILDIDPERAVWLE